MQLVFSGQPSTIIMGRTSNSNYTAVNFLQAQNVSEWQGKTSKPCFKAFFNQEPLHTLYSTCATPAHGDACYRQQDVQQKSFQQPFPPPSLKTSTPSLPINAVSTQITFRTAHP